MYAERDTFGPASLSILATRSSDKVSDVFDFILPLYYQSRMSARYGRPTRCAGLLNVLQKNPRIVLLRHYNRENNEVVEFSVLHQNMRNSCFCGNRDISQQVKRK
jgi:hypothetical protein